jgi:integration host factor subunit beta
MLDNYYEAAYAFWPGISTPARPWFLAYFYKGEGGMTKADLVDQVATTVQLPKHQTEAVITRFLEAIMAALQTEQRVDLRGFGSFRLRQRQARTGRNPRTGDTVPIPAKQVPTFTPGKAFQELVHPATARAHGATNGASRQQTTLW